MLNIKTIDASVLSRMFLAGAKNLEAKKEWINELNVFPVPDGDTGTNMTMTIMSAAAEPRRSLPVLSVEPEETQVLSFPSYFEDSPRALRKLRNSMHLQLQQLWTVQ